VKACGKGSYGRLGMGDSNTQHHLKSIPMFVSNQIVIRSVSSSKGSDGHTLAISDSGRVYSWGDGDYGKLGHGNRQTTKSPKLIEALSDKVVICVSAGFRHSAAVTECNELYTWGEGDHGRLGHGNTEGRQLPTLVQGISGVGSVVCGSSHTMVLSSNGMTVWSFGGGDHGKLGNGGTINVSSPKVIDSLTNTGIEKIGAGSQYGIALTRFGQIYVWGSGHCLGMEASTSQPLPVLLEALADKNVFDISAGDSHCLALTQDCEVYAWGSNTMGQCGVGDLSSPVKTPQRVKLLEGIPVQQVSTGTSHSVAWTVPPTGRRTLTWHKPYCIEVNPKTFEKLRCFLEQYAVTLSSQDKPLPPFSTKSEQEDFVLTCLCLLQTHVNLAELWRRMSGLSLDSEMRKLRQLIFQLIDLGLPAAVQQVICKVVSAGASLLLPPLQERLELLHGLLPQGTSGWNDLTTGQRLQLNVFLESLHDSRHVAMLLGPLYKASEQSSEESSAQLAANLMKTVLGNLCSHTERAIQRLVDDSEKDDLEESSESPSQLLPLLALLHRHLMSVCLVKSSATEKETSVVC
jgi:E3 ubiquitin-protein ligase HERC1